MNRAAEQWQHDRAYWIATVKALLREPNSRVVRARALKALFEVFEDDDLEGVQP